MNKPETFISMAINDNDGAPKDFGLSHLGLLMQVMGTLGLAVNVIATVVVLTAGSGGLMLWGIVVIASGIARSLKHRQAGVLLATSDRGGREGAKSYARLSLLQILGLIALAVMVTPDAWQSASSLAWLAIVFGLWPATVYALVMRAPVREAYDKDQDPYSDPPMPQDRGLQGTAVLMTTFGAIGCLFSLAMALLILPNIRAIRVESIAMILLWMAFAARAMSHLWAGLGGINGNHDATVAGIRRYESLSLLSVAVFIAYALFAGGGVRSLMTTAFLVAVLMAWPLTLSSVVKSLPWEPEDAEAPSGEAPDGGRSALGFVLIASSVFMGLQITTGLLSPHPALSASSAGMSADVTLIASAVTSLWAGVELATFGARHRIAGTLYGIVGIVTTVIAYGDTMVNMNQVGFGVSGAGVSVAIAAQLALPLAVLWAVNRD